MLNPIRTAIAVRQRCYDVFIVSTNCRLAGKGLILLCRVLASVLFCRLNRPCQQNGSHAVRDEVPVAMCEPAPEEGVAGARHVGYANDEHHNAWLCEAHRSQIHHICLHGRIEVIRDEGRPEENEEEEKELDRREDHGVVAHHESRTRQPTVIQPGDDIDVRVAIGKSMTIPWCMVRLEPFNRLCIVEPLDVGQGEFSLDQRYVGTDDDAKHAGRKKKPLPQPASPANSFPLRARFIEAIIPLISGQARQVERAGHLLPCGAPLWPGTGVHVELERNKQSEHPSHEKL
mmetsp:Transcript_59516/g.141949  ORF Transcript_59516/g.141949 Transcript_59516/m.141949 type:complete len:288 (-) Transcript_59516:911-1774(-)